MNQLSAHARPEEPRRVPRTASARLRLAELTSGIGAGVIGLGLGVMFANALRPRAVLVLVLGMAMHAWGMADKHRLERGAESPVPWWSVALYWFCWGALLLLVVYVAVKF